MFNRSKARHALKRAGLLKRAYGALRQIGARG